MLYLFISERFRLKYHLPQPGKEESVEFRLFSSKEKAINYLCWYYLCALYGELDLDLALELLKESGFSEAQIEEILDEEKEPTALEVSGYIHDNVKENHFKSEIESDLFEIKIDIDLR